MNEVLALQTDVYLRMADTILFTAAIIYDYKFLCVVLQRVHLFFSISGCDDVNTS